MLTAKSSPSSETSSAYWELVHSSTFASVQHLSAAMLLSPGDGVVGGVAWAAAGAWACAADLHSATAGVQLLDVGQYQHGKQVCQQT